ncbi:hypothetical protein VNO78_18132 [Psophocarpus tetragonolobus]|uniref:Uncharacterized protein n=1 Tax=Psophocarpus tetragonolobus TaxID=3891 RepID=A0AAN9SNW5_PSOTE
MNAIIAIVVYTITRIMEGIWPPHTRNASDKCQFEFVPFSPLWASSCCSVFHMHHLQASILVHASQRSDHSSTSSKSQGKKYASMEKINSKNHSCIYYCCLNSLVACEMQ